MRERPQEFVGRLRADVVNLLSTVEAKNALGSQGFDAAGTAAPEFARCMRAEAEKWSAVVRITGATPDQIGV